MNLESRIERLEQIIADKDAEERARRYVRDLIRTLPCMTPQWYAALERRNGGHTEDVCNGEH